MWNDACAAFAEINFDTDKLGAPAQNKEATNLPSTFFKTGPAALHAPTGTCFAACTAALCACQQSPCRCLTTHAAHALAGDQLQEKLGFNSDADNLKDRTNGSAPGACSPYFATHPCL